MNTDSPSNATALTPTPTRARVRLTRAITVVDQLVPRGTEGTAQPWWTGAACVSLPGVYGSPVLPRAILAPVQDDLAAATPVVCADGAGETRVGTVRRVFGAKPSSLVLVEHAAGEVRRYARRQVRRADSSAVASPAPARTSTALIATASPNAPSPTLSVYLQRGHYDAFASACAARGLSMSAVAVTWLLEAALAAGRQVLVSEFPGAERLLARRGPGRAQVRRGTTARRTLEVYLYGREREHVDALAVREHRSASNLMETLVMRGLAGAGAWPQVAVPQSTCPCARRRGHSRATPPLHRSRSEPPRVLRRLGYLSATRSA